MKKIVKIIVLISIILFAFQLYSFAYNPIDYTPPGITGADKVVDIAKPIINIISVIGIVVAVITLIVIGLKYMMGSVQEKAEYKKTLIPYVIGVTLLVSITQILKIIIELVESMKI